MAINSALLHLAQHRIWRDAGGRPMEKIAVVPAGGDPVAGGAPPMNPAAAGVAPPMGAPPMGAPPMGAPPMGAPPMAPAAAGGVPPMGGAPPMGGPPGMLPGAAMPGAVDPMTGMSMAGGKMKPEQYMQMLDFRLYNLQQQITTLMNNMGIKMDPGVLVTPPGAPMGPPPEAAMQGGPMDTGQGSRGQGGGNSAISPITPVQGASPELAMGGAEKIGAASTFADYLEKVADGKAAAGSTAGDGDEEGPRHRSSPGQLLKGPHPGVRPATQNITAGGSKDPQARTETDATMAAIGEKSAMQQFGEMVAQVPRDAGYIGSPFMMPDTTTPFTNAAAVAAMLRNRTTAG